LDSIDSNEKVPLVLIHFTAGQLQQKPPVPHLTPDLGAEAGLLKKFVKSCLARGFPVLKRASWCSPVRRRPTRSCIVVPNKEERLAQ
jgi:hypothetical protein